MVRRYVVTGRDGQVVRALVERTARLPGIELMPVGRPDLDLVDPATIERALCAARPDLIISAAAYTAVDQAENDAGTAFAVNAAAVGEIGRIAAGLRIPVVHLSTDYVFDGSKTSPYVEEDGVNPLGVYGHSKLDGEISLASSGADHAILRTSWVYSPFGKNFVQTMLRIAESRDDVNVVADQIGNPTSAFDIADGVLKVATNLLESREPSLRGIFHMTGAGDASWADFADAIFDVSRAARGPSARVHRITTAQYPTPARRPANSRLDCTKLQLVHGVRLPEWRPSMEAVVFRLLSN